MFTASLTMLTSWVPLWGITVDLMVLLQEKSGGTCESAAGLAQEETYRWETIILPSPSVLIRIRVDIYIILAYEQIDVQCSHIDIYSHKQTHVQDIH